MSSTPYKTLRTGGVRLLWRLTHLDGLLYAQVVRWDVPHCLAACRIPRKTLSATRQQFVSVMLQGLFDRLLVVTRSGLVLNPEEPEVKKYLILTVDVVVRGQAENAVCKSQRGALAAVAEKQVFGRYDGLIRRKRTIQGIEQLVVPASPKDIVFEREPYPPIGGHMRATNFARP